MNELRLCRLSDLPDRESRGFEQLREGEHPIFVIRRGAEVRAYRDCCPHEGSRMAWRRHEYLNAERDRIVCGVHGAQFDIDSGVCTLGPCLGRALERLQIFIEDEWVVLKASAAAKD
jgi:nitrite reductase/ring-hydroxylating ferredoxin subunit